MNSRIPIYGTLFVRTGETAAEWKYAGPGGSQFLLSTSLSGALTGRSIPSAALLNMTSGCCSAAGRGGWGGGRASERLPDEALTALLATLRRSGSRASGRMSHQRQARRSSLQNASPTFTSEMICCGWCMPCTCAFTCVKPPTTYAAATRRKERGVLRCLHSGTHH